MKSKVFFFYLIASLSFVNFLFPQQAYPQENPKEALYYRTLDNNSVNCQLCPRRCIIPQGKRGFCGVRENREGTLYALSYGKLVAIHIDPIEKKPLFHFLPGSQAFSIATAGCNLRCKFCQNWAISQKRTEDLAYEYLEPAALIERAKKSGAETIAFTYTEPVIFYEYMLEVAKLAKAAKIKTVMHSNGYVNEEPLKELAKYLDAANIDLKGFSDEYYAKLAEGTLEPVLRTLKVLKEGGVHLEITNLILPGFNDDEATIRRMCIWIRKNLGLDTPLHFSRFFPTYKLVALIPTPVEALKRAKAIAEEEGLRYVYIGNLAGNPAENTICPACKKIIIRRSGYTVLENNLKEGKCSFCGQEIKGVWR
ncbi:MAG: AmmeMemoRadiSam system radical SAM enzyme [Candidatus Omnitrophota bacterium]